MPDQSMTREIKIPSEPGVAVDRDGPRARRGPPIEVPADIEPLRTTHRQLMTVVFEGGPLDGIDLDLPRTATTHQATVPFTEPAEPFQFDDEEFRRGKRNVVRGDYDTVNYRRTKRRSPEGWPVFEVASC